MPPESSPEEHEDVSGAFAAGAAPGSQDANPDASSPSESQDAKTADSSAADGKDVERSSLDVVADAIKTERSGESFDPEGQDGQQPGEEAKAEGDKDAEADADPKDDDLPPFHEHPRWKQVQQELKELRPLKERVDALKPKAEALDQLNSYITESHLEHREVNEGFEVMRLMKNEPEKAIPLLKGYLQQLRSATGHELSPELKQQVEQGYLSEEHARQLSLSQSREARSTAAAEAARREAERLQRERQHTSQTQTIVQAVEQWDVGWKQSDPDYALKADRVKEKIQLHLYELRAAGNEPQTPAEAVELAKAAKKQVDDEFRRFRPKRDEVKPTVSDGASGKSDRQPQTSLDVVNAALAG